MKIKNEIINELVKILIKGLDQGDTFSAVFDLIEKTITFESATLYIYNQKEDNLEIMH